VGFGRHTSEDDIHLFYGAGLGVLQSDSDMHGGEYIVNAQASTKHFDRLVEINSFTSGDDYEPMKSIPLTDGSRVFNTNGAEESLSLLIDAGEYVINRAATIKFYEELEEINNSVSSFPPLPQPQPEN
jgi:hypothetical protein